MVFCTRHWSRLIFLAAVLISAAARADQFNDRMKKGREAMATGNLDEAAAQFEAALSTKGMKSGDMREFLALEALGQVAERAGRTAEAERFYMQSLESRRQSGMRPVAELGALSDLGYFYSRQKRWTDQINMLQRTAEIWSHAAGPQVPAVAQYESAIGLAQVQLDDYPDAEAAFRKALEVLRANSDTDPAAVSLLVGYLANAVAAQGRSDEADKLFRDGLAQLKGAPGQANAWNRLTGDYVAFLKKNGRTTEADELDKQVHGAAVPASATQAKPRLIHKQDPAYSEIARKLGLQGTVVLTLIVGEDGQAHDVHVIEPLGVGLDDKAVGAVETWRFQPGMIDGKPVKVSATIEVNFRLL